MVEHEEGAISSCPEREVTEEPRKQINTAGGQQNETQVWSSTHPLSASGGANHGDGGQSR